MEEEGTRNLWKSVLWTIFSPGILFSKHRVLALCSPSVALEKAPGGWLQAGSQGPAEILLHSGSSSWPCKGYALSPGNSYSLISSWNTTQFCLIDMRYTVAIRLWVPQGRVYMLLLGSYVSKLESGTELGVQPTCWTEAKLVYWISLGHLQLVCCAQQTVSVRHTPGSSLFCWSLLMSPNPIQISASLPSQKLLVLSVFHVSLTGNYKIRY